MTFDLDDYLLPQSANLPQDVLESLRETDEEWDARMQRQLDALAWQMLGEAIRVA